MTARAPRSIPLRDPSASSPRCAPFRAALGVDPVGTAGAYDAFLAVEVPLPWERDISMSEPFRSLLPPGRSAGPALDGADGRRWRPVGLVPAGDPSEVTVLAFEPPSGGGAAAAPGVVRPLRRTEWRVPAGDVDPLCASLLAGDDVVRRRFDPAVVATPPELVELLVCTHGRRDVCCGGSGTSLHRTLAGELAGDRRVRLWRCSHTGGHRFAPTALTFPDAYGWAHLDPATALAVARRDVPPSRVAGACRGSALVAGGAAQAAEREGLVRAGWGWAGSERVVEVVDGSGVGPSPGDVTTLRVSGTAPNVDRSRGAVELLVTVEVAELVPTPTCGAGVDDDTEVEPVWRVRSVVDLDG